MAHILMRLAYSTLYLFYVTTKMSLFDYITVFDVFWMVYISFY
jgi:hypothetical protein